MSGFASVALPGTVPTIGPGRKQVTPESLFKDQSEKKAYQNLIDSVGARPDIANKHVKSVNVRIFDLSDKKQVEEYEKLSKELWDKTSRMEVLVDSRKDLVHRKDGTSYWMKYVEYVEFGDGNEAKKGKEDGQR